MNPTDDDPYRWLEDVEGEQALAWVRERNAESEGLLTARPEYAPIREQLLAVLNSKERIPQVSRRGDHFYNLWRDDTHPRGLWRRATLAEYRQPSPVWETVLDIDALAAAEGENWVWAGANALDTAPQRCMVSLSRGGADATVVREFDTASKQFVEDGFTLPEAKSSVTWIDENTLYVGTDVGPGSLTDSGYPRLVQRWTRGTPLASAVTVFEGEATDVSVSVSVDLTPGHERTFFSRSLDFYHQQHFLLQGDTLVPFDLPSDASFSFWNHAGDAADTLLIELRSDWTIGGSTYASGSLLAADALAYLSGERQFTVLFRPTATCSLAGYSTTREHLIVNLLDNVASRLELWRRMPGGFEPRAIDAPSPGSLSVRSLHDPMRYEDPLAESYLLGYTDFLTPDSLFLGQTEADPGPAAGPPALELLKARPALFDATGLRAEQRFAISADGTRVPYFIVWPRGAEPDGLNPTLLYGYGGFEISLNPWYPAGHGRAWFERGGALVVANIRGGGEFGPTWHQAAVRQHKQRSYDDFIAVAEDLIAGGVTSPGHLGIMGGSNGGLLVGAVFTQRPELFNAVVCQVPLLDMRRYHTLLAGASWMAEFGNPDVPEDWVHIVRYSPYHNLSPDKTYPEVLFTTSTRDDRVHPAHARKMAARMRELGHALLYYENIEGGHGGAADNAQRAHLQALEFAYLWRQLGKAD
jgi:prolyl oligopeptidase